MSILKIYNSENYLPNLYSKLPCTDSYNFLKEQCAHICIKNDAEFIDDNIKNINLKNITSFIYNKLDKKNYSKQSILSNIYHTNNTQIKKLSKQKFIVKYPSTIEREGKIKQCKLHPSLKNIFKRSLVIYFRGPWRDYENTAGMDIYHTSVLYKVLELMVKNKNFNFFNDIELVQSDPDLEGIDAFKKNNIKVNKSKGNDFITITSLFANTIHINGGELPDKYSYTLPILSKSFPYFNNFNLNDFNSDLLINAIYPEIQYKNNSINYCKDLERYCNNKITSWFNICKDSKNMKIIKQQDNYKNVYKFVDNVVKIIYNLEEYLKDDRRK